MGLAGTAAQSQVHGHPDSQGYRGHHRVGGQRRGLGVHAATFEHRRQLQQEQGRGHRPQAVHDPQEAGGLAAAGVAHVVGHQGNDHGADGGNAGGVDHPAQQQARNVAGEAVHEDARGDQHEAHGRHRTPSYAVGEGAPQANGDDNDDLAPEIQVATDHSLARLLQPQHFLQQEGLGLGDKSGEHDGRVAGEIEGHHVAAEDAGIEAYGEESSRLCRATLVWHVVVSLYCC